MIVSGGENVYPGPVAAVITEHPDVSDVLLESVADPEFGQRLRATVEIHPGRALTADQLRDWLRPRLSDAERPRDLSIVPASTAPPPASRSGSPRFHVKHRSTVTADTGRRTQDDVSGPPWRLLGEQPSEPIRTTRPVPTGRPSGKQGEERS